MNIQTLITETEERLHFLKSLLTKIKFTPKSKKRKPIKSITILKPIIPNNIIKKAHYGSNVRNTFIIIDNKHNVDLDMNQWEDDYRNYEPYDGEMCNDLRHGQGKLYKYSKDAHYECDENKKRLSERIYTEKIIYTEKVDYEGEWVNGLRNGHGKSYRVHCKFYIDNGKLEYEGYWKNDLKHGHGKYYRDNELTYEGEWKNDLRNGQGKSYNTCGELEYDGEWKNDLRNGKGKSYECEELIYDGEWKNDLIHETWYPDVIISDELASFLKKEKGSIMAKKDVTKEMTNYIHEHSHQARMNGPKILHDDKLKKLLKVSDSDKLTYLTLQKFMSPHLESDFKNYGKSYNEYGQLIYEGQIKHNLKHGEGKSYKDSYKDGQLEYHGNWARGMYNGYGKRYKDGQLIYEGQFENDMYNGKGKSYRDGQLIYEGQFKKDMYNGYGKMYEDGQLIYEGQYKHNLKHGEGKFYISPNVFYEGQFNCGLRHGKGKMYNRKGAIIREGMWNNDLFNESRTSL